MTCGEKRKLQCPSLRIYVLSHRRVDLINLSVFGDGVIDAFLDGKDVVFIAQVTGSLPYDLDATRCWQSCEIHSCGRLNTEAHFDRTACMKPVTLFMYYVNLQPDQEACSRRHWSGCVSQTEHSCSVVSVCSLTDCAARIPWKAAGWRWLWHSLHPGPFFLDGKAWKSQHQYH